jgi:ferrous iron transport protein B
MRQTIALAGNPNAGKTSLFNILTGTRQYVGNWPGVTVEKKEGRIRRLSDSLLVDLPGIYSLSAQSEEEKLATAYLLRETPDMILNIVDAANLERNLYFSVQLLEMGIPVVIALNMMDVAASRGIAVDGRKLEARLGVPVIPMIARKAKGQEELLKCLSHAAFPSSVKIPYPAPIEAAIARLAGILAAGDVRLAPSPRWLATMWLERNAVFDEYIRALLDPGVLAQMEQVRMECEGIPEFEIRNARYAWIERLLGEVAGRRTPALGRNWSDRIDSLVLHRYLGIPLFLAFMFVVFQITFSWVGTSLSDRLDVFISGPVSGGLQSMLIAMNSPDWFTRLMVDGVLAGVGAVIVFVPQIASLFLCLSFLEDSGYMARVAILMDRFMRAIGLNGRAFIPLILGFGCNVPAIMATRALDSPKGRLVTAFISPFMSCSARLSVYSLFVAAFFAKGQAVIVFALYLTGIVIAVLTAFLMKSFVRAEEGLFLMELPPYRAPMVKSLLLLTWDKAKGFVRKAGTIIFGMSVLLWFLGHFSIHGMAAMNESFLALVGGWIAPVFAPLGFDTWQAGVSLITGFMAKEVVVATMGIVYEAGESTLGALLRQAFTPAAALSFLFFILLYTPCLSTVVMMKKETGSWKWTLLSIVYSFAVAWIIAFIVYRLALLFD